MEEVNVQVKFTIIEKDFPSFSDALYFTFDEYAELESNKLEALEQERFQNFKEFILNPPPSLEIPPEEKLQSLIDQREELDNQISKLQEEIN